MKNYLQTQTQAQQVQPNQQGVTRPMGNAYDRTRNYLSVPGPSSQAGQYTTNVNGSQTAQAPVQRPGSMPQQMGYQNYLAARNRVQNQMNDPLGSIMPTGLTLSPAQGEHVDGLMQKNYLQPSESYQRQTAEMNRLQGQQMGAIQGSQAFQSGPSPADLSKWYSDQAKDRFAMSPGGANMIQRAQQMSALAGGISPAGLSQGQQYAADMAKGRATLAANFTGDGTAGPDGLYVVEGKRGGLALTSGGMARYIAETGSRPDQTGRALRVICGSWVNLRSLVS